ncbi:DivIVA domain repeat protein [Gardnerella pickettii JCP7659]|uniref:DivIVA domain-containing protein n=1 Tax=Gardnerella TaxID=2701 RepID=UPI0003537F12|nr:MULTISPECIES: DivIVA domain-containing protein [Gardnerella]EPI54592.1 DivIVA domain repeat protein [Gardnerella pickettii JCP7659]RDW96919.1 cell division protein DivIVA [Gardnerella vaginalis]
MASKPDTARNSSGIERVGKRKKGYSVEQVNDFLERAHSLYESSDISLTQKDIQDVSFDLEDEGYAIPQVDAALSRLERAVVDKTTQYEISNRGKIVWKAQADEEYRVLLSHSQRDYKMRFDSAQSRKPSYDKKQVDNVVNKSLDKIAVLLGYNPVWGSSLSDLDKIDAMFVSNVLFTQRSGKRGYDERQVDYYLNACVRLLSRLESYDRVAKYTDFDSSDSVDSANFGVSAKSNNDLQENVVSKTSSAPSVVEPSVVAPSAVEPKAAPAPSPLMPPAIPPSIPVEHHAQKAIFTPHSASVEASDDTDDEMSQASTVMPPAFPPSYAPNAASNNFATNNNDFGKVKDAEKKEDSANVVSANADGVNNANANNASNNNVNDSKSIGDLNLSLLASPKFEPSQSLNLDIPDLSFPVMNHFDTSVEDSSREANNDSDDFDDTGESNFGGFVNPNHN